MPAYTYKMSSQLNDRFKKTDIWLPIWSTTNRLNILIVKNILVHFKQVQKFAGIYWTQENRPLPIVRTTIYKKPFYLFISHPHHVFLSGLFQAIATDVNAVYVPWYPTIFNRLRLLTVKEHFEYYPLLIIDPSLLDDPNFLLNFRSFRRFPVILPYNMHTALNNNSDYFTRRLVRSKQIYPMVTSNFNFLTTYTYMIRLLSKNWF